MNSRKLNDQFGLSHLINSIFSSLNLADTNDYLSLGQGQMRECVVLIDGMGQDAINKFADQFSIFEELKQIKTIYTDFPSTTATSISTLGTGVLPGLHGMLGYTVRVPRSDNRLLNARMQLINLLTSSQYLKSLNRLKLFILIFHRQLPPASQLLEPACCLAYMACLATP